MLELRSKTSGAAFPVLRFEGFHELVNEDPFWVPSTEAEIEEHGEHMDKQSLSMAFKYLTMLRKSKGLYVESALVENAEKQRTLKR